MALLRSTKEILVRHSMKRARSRPARCPALWAGVVLLAPALFAGVAVTARAQAPEPLAGAAGPEIVALAPPDDGKQRRSFQLEASWEDGLRLRSADDQFHVHVGGNAQIDSTWLIGPKGVFAVPGGGTNGVENASATFLRRARLRVEGDLFDQFDYIVEYDFAHGENENSGLQPASFNNLIGTPV